tara:strand:+ start:3146 stop:3979 length:834 start_codon:yes stop_codon:yes gene_type:complete
MSSRPPPIPRKAVAPNIIRAREQIAKEKNLQRAKAMVEKARQNKARRQVFSQDELDRVERVFQSRNELDAIREIEKRNNLRQEVARFQTRQAQRQQLLDNLEDARERGKETRKIADARSQIKRKLESEEFKTEVAKEGVAGRKLTTGRDTRLLANALFGGAGLQAVAEESLKHTSVKPSKIGGRPEGLGRVEIGTINPAELQVIYGEGEGGSLVPLPAKGQARPRRTFQRGATGGKVIGTQAGGGFKLGTPPQPFLVPEPEPEPEPEINPFVSRRRV